MSANAKQLDAALGDYPGYPMPSVNELARHLGWGWHRTNNAMKELGLK